MIANIKTVAVYVSDQKEALRFYTEKLGFGGATDRIDGSRRYLG